MRDGRSVPPAPPFNLAAHRVAHPFDWMEDFTVVGTLAVTTYQFKLPVVFRSALVDVYAFVGTAPTGASIILDLNSGDAANPGAEMTVFTDQAKRPVIAAGAYDTGPLNELDIDQTIVEARSYVTLDVDQVGSSTKGADLVVATFWRFAI